MTALGGRSMRLDDTGGRTALENGDAFASLKIPSTIRSLRALAFAWSLVAFAGWLTLAPGGLWSGLAIVVFGTAMRRLAVLLHDAGHRRLSRSRRINDALGQLLLALPLCTELRTYRKDHLRHHRELGVPGLDVDLVNKSWPARGGWVWLWGTEVLSPRALLSGLLGACPRLALVALTQVACWWMTAGVMLTVALGWERSVWLVTVWLLARLLMFHPLTTFVIISDHFGLDGKRLGARTSPTSGVARRIVHPLNNGYHLAHHLYPAVPCHQLRELDAQLLASARYRSGERCERYLVGNRSVVRSWESSQHSEVISLTP